MKPVTPEARIASALEGNVRFSPRSIAGKKEHCYETELSMGCKALLEVSLLGEPEGFLEVVVDGKPEARVRFNKEWLEFWPLGSNERQEDIDHVLASVERLARQGQEAGGGAFMFEGSTPLGLRMIAYEAGHERQKSQPQRESRFKLNPKPGETRDPGRIDRIIPKLEEAWKAQPDMRLGQLVSVLAALSGAFGGDTFMAEDDDIEAVLDERKLESLAAKSP